MINEIEKKYLIKEGELEYVTEALFELYEHVDALKEDVLANGKQIKQGYMPIKIGENIADILGLDVEFEPKEARLRDKAGKYFFTMKGEGGLVRNEIEYEIDQSMFNDYWNHTKGNRVEKFRLKRPYQGFEIEIDVYTDRDLIVAEIEVPTTEDAFSLIAIGKDITEDKRYKNKNLAK